MRNEKLKHGSHLTKPSSRPMQKAKGPVIPPNARAHMGVAHFAYFYCLMTQARSSPLLGTHPMSS